jgi:mono/diheme cytochrome c family protein
MNRVMRALIGTLAGVGALAIVAGLALAVTGVATHKPPPALEVTLARTARHYLIPVAQRNRSNPVPASVEWMAEAERHWADHCAVCHGNDGRGDTAIGRGLYPRAPDMTLPATQDLSDGELLWIIEHGVKLTGMPAWGTADPDDDDRESWELVHFVRHLPNITKEHLRAMEKFNPISREELDRQLAIERFLSGEETEPPPSEHGDHHH